jgi:hypothetical protein
MRRVTFDKSFYISNMKLVDPAEYGGAVDGFEAYDNTNGKLHGMVFFGKQAKPIWHFNFPSRERFIQRVKEARDNWAARQQAKQEAVSAKKAFVHSVKVGDVFGTSWGYEQTNREFFQVVEVKGKSVVIRELAQEGGRADDPGFGPMAGTTRYIKDKFLNDELITKLVLQGNEIKFASYRWGSLVTDEQNEKGFYVSWGH